MKKFSDQIIKTKKINTKFLKCTSPKIMVILSGLTNDAAYAQLHVHSSHMQLSNKLLETTHNKYNGGMQLGKN